MATKAAVRYEANKEQVAVTGAAWKKANPESVRAKRARYKVVIKGQHDKLDIELAVDYRKAIAHDPCFYCGGPGEEDDHYQSLANGGTDHWWNLVRSCRHCNRSKGPRDGSGFINIVKGTST